MSTRRSTRIQTQPNAPPSYREDSEEPDTETGPTQSRKRKLEEDGPSPAPSTSAQSTGIVEVGVEAARQDKSHRPTKRVKGRRGVLQQLVEMPLDLLFEIFGQLNPFDVLNLARSTKALRAILMSRSSANIWRSALSNMEGLPPCPPDLNEPQWVDLTFGKNCQSCGKTNAHTNQTYAWQARVRGCSTCVLAEFPITDSGYQTHHLLALTPSFLNRSQGRRSQRGLHYHGKTYKEFLQTEKTLTNPEERKMWVDQKKENKAALVAHAGLCEKWIADRASERAQSLADQREQRKQDLRERLEDIGYDSMVDLVFDKETFWKCPCISTCLKRDMTDRAWANIEDKVVEVMERFRGEYNKVKREKDLKTRFKALQEAHAAYLASRHPSEVYGVIPPLGDIFQIPEVREVVLTEPLSNPIDSGALGKLFERMPEFGLAWRQKAYEKMADLMKPHADVLGLGVVDELSPNLAIAIFTCPACYDNGRMHSSRVLVHRCFSECYSYREIPEDADLRAFVAHTARAPLGIYNNLTFKLNIALSAVAVVIAAGLDPKTATVEDMDALDPLFKWKAEPHDVCEIWTWRGLSSRESVVASDVALVDEERSVIVRHRFDEIMKSDRATGRWSKYIYCAHCYTRTGNSKEIRGHLKHAHDIHPAKDEDIWIHPDHPSGRMSFTYYGYPPTTLI